ncbi:hypothetical protein [Actinacidiphila glaucinigra]|uniref:hypothetical protein n=1 Tax=Actinacidiphila glaucinigra TaxID=235986 RepID=UPI00366C13F2
MGLADVPGSLVLDVLNDHFSMGPEDAEGYFAPSDKYDLKLLVPAGQEATTPGVHAVWEWAIRCELPYAVLWDESGNAQTVDVLGNVENPDSDIHVTGDLFKAMVDRLGEAENPMLMVLSTDGQLDPSTAEAAANALRAGIPCHDLSRALLEVTWRHLPDHEPPQEEPELETEAGGQMALAVPDGAPSVTLSPGEAAAVGQSLSDAEAFVEHLYGALLPQVEELRRHLIHGRSLLAPRPAAAETEDAEPKKTRLEIFNPESGLWEPAGRGRPPKGAQKRRVPA